MQLAEIRELDGPNLFLLEPAIKLELILQPEETTAELATRFAPGMTNLGAAVKAALVDIYRRASLPEPRVVIRRMDDVDHIAIAWSWSRRQWAVDLAHTLFKVACGVLPINHVEVALPPPVADAEDTPLMIPDSRRRAIAVAVTGTNGKTTTTRLIAHIARTAGFRTGWNSSSGIYVEGEEIEAGDYSGPSGARRVLEDPTVGFAVLETARGGILLRGLGFEHNDVSVFTNVSADHLELQGVRTLQTLAEVKSVVCKVTKPGGSVVVNAADPLVMSVTEHVSAPRTLFARNPGSDVLAKHREAGGTAIRQIDNAIVVSRGDNEVARFPIDRIPIAFGGRAGHMVENAMAAIGAALGAGIQPNHVADGLATFSNDSAHNPGRLNLYRINGATVVLDFAHNEDGLRHLIDFASPDVGPDGRLIAIIGTAGDRTDSSLFELGRMAAERADIVIAKGTEHYLRGRSPGDLMSRYRSGAEAGGVKNYLESASEITAMQDALTMAAPGDVIVIMAQEHVARLADMLEAQRD